MHTLRFALALILAISLHPCHAQDQDNLRLQFMTFPMTAEPLEVEMVTGEGTTVKLSVPSNEFSDPLTVPRMQSLAFGKTYFDEVNKKPAFKIYGQGPPAPGSRQLVLLLRKEADMAGGVEVRAVPCDVNNFSGGKFLLINAARIDIGGRSGKTEFALKPGKNTIITPDLEPNGRLTHVEFFYNNNGKAEPFFSSMWPVAKHYRGVIFFYHDPNNANKIQIHSFRDFLENGG